MTQENEKEINEKEINEKEINEKEIMDETMSELPPVTFESFIFNLYNIALLNLGYRDPESGKIIRDLLMAKHTIDTLGMLEEKTKGNLTLPESNLMENLLYELRMNYLRALNVAQNEIKEQPKADNENENSQQ
jgi:hypothetical protein